MAEAIGENEVFILSTDLYCPGTFCSGFLAIMRAGCMLEGWGSIYFFIK